MNELAEVLFERCWCSPNLREHWRERARRRRRCQGQASIYMATLPPAVRAAVSLREPVKRFLSIRVLTMRAVDHDNLIAGCKEAIDSLQAWYRRRVGREVHKLSGPGLIWDDQRAHCEILEITREKQPVQRRGDPYKDLIITVLEPTAAAVPDTPR